MAEMQIDPEIGAMSALAKALSPLEVEAQGRVLRWAAARYGVGDLKAGGGGGKGNAEDGGGSRGTGEESRSFGTIHELFERATYKTQIEKALISAYWFQVVQGASGFGSQALNTELKNMGIGIANITDSLSSAEAAKPALIMQTAKAGKARQARKTYKLTVAGIKAVEAMISDE